MRRALATLVLAASAACSPSAADRAGSTATVPTEPPRTTTTNPYAVPAVIDAAYVNRVLAGLDAAVGDIVRLVIRTKAIPPEAIDRLKALYADPGFLQIQINNFQTDARKNFVGYRPDPGNASTVVSELITGKTACIFARVQREFSAVVATGSNLPHSLWIELRPLDRSRDPNQYNPTTWAFVYDGFPPDRSQPADPCVA